MGNKNRKSKVKKKLELLPFPEVPITIRIGEDPIGYGARSKPYDCTMLPYLSSSNEQCFVLLDTGTKQTVQYITKARNKYNSKIAGVVLSHFDDDHSLGLKKMLPEILYSQVMERGGKGLENMDSETKYSVTMHFLQEQSSYVAWDGIEGQLGKLDGKGLSKLEQDMFCLLEGIKGHRPFRRDILRPAMHLYEKITQRLKQVRQDNAVQRLANALYSTHRCLPPLLDCKLGGDLQLGDGDPFKLIASLSQALRGLFSTLRVIRPGSDEMDAHLVELCTEYLHIVLPFPQMDHRFKNMVESLEVGCYEFCSYLDRIRERNCAGTGEPSSEISESGKHLEAMEEPNLTLELSSMLIACLPPSMALEVMQRTYEGLRESQQNAIEALRDSLKWIAFPTCDMNSTTNKGLLKQLALFASKLGTESFFVHTSDNASNFIYQETGKKMLPFHFSGDFESEQSKNTLVVCQWLTKDFPGGIEISSLSELGSMPQFNEHQSTSRESSLLTLFRAMSDDSKNYLFTGDSSLSQVRKQLPDDLKSQIWNGAMKSKHPERAMILELLKSCVERKFHLVQLPNHGSLASFDIGEGSVENAIPYLTSLANHVYISGTEQFIDNFPSQEVLCALMKYFQDFGTGAKILSAYDYTHSKLWETMQPACESFAGLLGETDPHKPIDLFTQEKIAHL